MVKKSSFRFLWMGQSLANSGDVFYVVGLMALIYTATGSALVMSLVPFFNTLSRFVSGLIAPLTLTRFGLKKTLLYSQLGKTVVLCGFAVFSSLSVSSRNLFFIFLFVILISFLDGWAVPARNAMVPFLIGPEKLVRANSFLSILDQSINMSGWALGGVLAARLGGSALVWITLFLFITSTLCMSRIEELGKVQTHNPGADPTSRWDVLKEGWIVIWETPLLRVISITDVVGSMAQVVWVAAIIYVFVSQVLHVGESWWGYINFSFFAGLILGGLISMRWSHVMNKNLGEAALAGTFFTSSLTLWFGLNTFSWAALLLSMLFGCFEQVKAVSFQTLVQTNACPISQNFRCTGCCSFGELRLRDFAFWLFN